ncbi:MAG: hypothetical protein HC804_04575 [Anaerolineae bacterium]|nr:hypothetical protein [Anaerolineae bacterium]
MSICDGASASELLVEYSDDPSLTWNSVSHTWVDVSGVNGMLDVTGGDKEAAMKRTFGGGVKAGVTGPGLQNVVLDVLFENDANSFLEFLTDTWDGTVDKCYFIRWSFNNGASGALRRTAKVVLLTNPHPGGDANSAEPVSKQLTHVVDGIINRDAVP